MIFEHAEGLLQQDWKREKMGEDPSLPKDEGLYAFSRNH